VWFTDGGSAPAIGKITPAGVITEYTAGLNSGSAPYEIVSAPEGNLWFLDNGATPAIGKVQLPPVVTTGAASLVTTTSETVSGTANPLGAATTTTFHYGTTTALGSTATATALAATGTAQPVTATLSGLPRDTTIYYQLTATNTSGTTSGATRTFTTGATTGSRSHVRTIKAKLYNQRITLTIPPLDACAAKTLSATLTSTRIPKSRAPKLRFKNAAFYIGKVSKRDHKRTLRHLPANLTLSLGDLRSGLHTLAVVVSYSRSRHKKTVTKTLKASLRVC
jgi:hypothetical protein